MSLLPPGWTPFLVTAAVLVVPYIVTQLRAAAKVRDEDDDRETPPSKARPFLSLLVLLNSLWIIYRFYTHGTQNIFNALNVPFTIPSDKLRSILLQHTQPHRDALPVHLETLLTRLSSYDVRTLYVRFGHDAINNCDHCTSFYDFALFALVKPALEYLRVIVLYGLITMRGTGRERLRVLGTGLLVGAATFEAWYLSTVDIKIPRDGFGVIMWHDQLHRYREILFLLLPAVVHNLPASPPPAPSPLFALQPTVMVLDKAVTKLRVLDYARAATIREPVLRTNAQEWWGRQREEGEWAQKDEILRTEAERLGLGYNRASEQIGEGTADGKLMGHVRSLVQELIQLTWGVRAPSTAAGVVPVQANEG